MIPQSLVSRSHLSEECSNISIILHKVGQLKNEVAKFFRGILGTGNSSFPEGNPILVLFKPAAIMLLAVEAEPDGSISHGETLLCLETSKSSHLTYKDDKELTDIIK